MLKTVPDHGGSSSPFSFCFIITVGVLSLVLSVSTCISKDCEIAAVSGIVFAQYDPFSPDPATGSGSFKVHCGTAAQGRVLLSAGSSGTFSQRSMSGGRNDVLLYNLYENASRTRVWGDGEQGTYRGDFVFGNDGGDKEFFVYGDIPKNQNVAAQSFEDKLTITIEW